MVSTTGTWLAHPRLAVAVRAVESSPTARSVLEQVAPRRTSVRFEPAPTTVEQFELRRQDPLIASYQPMSNTAGFGAGFGIDKPFPVTARDGSTVLVDFGDTAVEDGVSLVHESVHRLQNRAGRAVVDKVIVQPFAAPLAGVRQLLHPETGESRGAAFLRGFDRRLLNDELEAYRVEARVQHELGRPDSFNGADGAYLGDDHALATIRPGYAAGVRRHWAASTVLTGGLTAFGASRLVAPGD